MTFQMRLVVSFVLAALATAAAAGDVLQRIASAGHVVVGFTDNAPPFSLVLQGQPTGYSIALCNDVVERIRQELGQPDLRVKMVALDQDQLPRFVGSAAVDLMCAGVSDTPQRRRTMSFSAPIFLSSVKLLVRAGDGPRAVAQLRGGTVAVLGRTTAEQAIQQLSSRRGLALKVSRVVSSDAALAQIRLRQADAWARDEVLLLGTLAREADGGNFKVLQDALSTEVIAIAMPRDDRLLELVNETLAQAVRSGRMEALYEQWFVQPNAASASGLKIPLAPALKAEFDRLR